MEGAAVAKAAVGVVAVHPGKSATSVYSCGLSNRWLPHPVLQQFFSYLITPASEPNAPRSKLRASNWLWSDLSPVTAVTLVTSLSLSVSATAYAGYIVSRFGLLIQQTAGSAWLSRTRHRSTTSLIGVSGETLSKCRRRSQLLWPAINLSRISRSRAVCPMSPKALTANISKAVATIAGSSPIVLVVRSNCLLKSVRRPGKP